MEGSSFRIAVGRIEPLAFVKQLIAMIEVRLIWRM